MCCCEKPNINGEFGYKWQPTDKPTVRERYPPALRDGDMLLYDEPGRCGGIDSHSHHYRVVLGASRVMELLVCHGGGQESIPLRTKSTLLSAFADLDSTARYWALNAIYHAYWDGRKRGTEDSDTRWREAAAEKRIKVRKVRGSNAVRVWVAPKIVRQAT